MDDGPFRLRVVTVGPGCERAYEEAEWRDALVVLQRGAIELVGRCGARRSFERGAVLFLQGLPLRALCNHGAEPATLVAVARRAQVEDVGGAA